MAELNQAILFCNGWIGYVLIALLLGTGLFFCVRTGLVQLRLFKRSIQEMVSGIGQRKPGEISPFQAFATGLASRVGAGNIVGVAVALGMGGPGAIFWMWITALVGMASSLIECSLAQLYKERQEDGTFRGGPAYYIQLGLGQRWLGIVFALALVLCFGLVFNAVQTNSIAGVITPTYGVPHWVIGLVLVALTAPVIFGGMRSVGVVAEVLVPLMAGAYLLFAGYAVVANIGQLPDVLLRIFQGAFGYDQAVGGFTGAVFASAITKGINRGLFSNEAGMGSAPNAAAAAAAPHPVTQALMQMLGVFIDTIIVCSATAFMILTSGEMATADVQGAALTQAALEHHTGFIGRHFLAVAMFFFCYSSILGNYAYAEGNVHFINRHPVLIILFRLLVLGMVYFGAVGTVPLIWNLADFSQAFMAILNLVAIMLLSGIALRLLRDYEDQVREGKPAVFTRDRIKDIPGKLSGDVWAPEREKTPGT